MNNLLHEGIERKLKKLEELEPGTKEYEAVLDTIVKLTDREIEIEKFNSDSEDKEKTREFEQKDRKIRNGISIAGIVVPMGLAIWGTLKSLKFEETGTVTSLIGRGWLNKLLPKK